MIVGPCDNKKIIVTGSRLSHCVPLNPPPVTDYKNKGTYVAVDSHAVSFFSFLFMCYSPSFFFLFLSLLTGRVPWSEKREKGKGNLMVLRSHIMWRKALGPDHQGTAKGKCVSANHSMGRHHFLFVCSFPSARLLLYACALTAIPWISSYIFFIHIIGMAGALRVKRTKPCAGDQIPDEYAHAYKLVRDLWVACYISMVMAL